MMARIRSRAASKRTDYGPEGAIYVRTTGIWQSVWLEPVPDIALRRPRITPDLANRTIPTGTANQRVTRPACACGRRCRMPLARWSAPIPPPNSISRPASTLPIPEDRLKLWDVGDPHLYDLDITLD